MGTQIHPNPEDRGQRDHRERAGGEAQESSASSSAGSVTGAWQAKPSQT